jgi:DNA-binding FrmR family transcriptional regulator
VGDDAERDDRVHDDTPPGVPMDGAPGSPHDLETTMQLPDETTADLIRRLRRIEGQVRGIQAMLTEQRDCADVVTQIAAANKALEQVGFKLVASGLTYCISNPAEAAEEGYDLARVEKMFTKIS